MDSGGQNEEEGVDYGKKSQMDPGRVHFRVSVSPMRKDLLMRLSLGGSVLLNGAVALESDPRKQCL
jgi:hypothetical protein